MSAEKLDHIAAGVVYDFAAYLTTRRVRITLSEIDDASPAAQAVQDFLRLRGIDTKTVTPFLQWQARCGSGGETAAGEAVKILSSAFRDDPHFAWTWHCAVACAAMDEGAPHDAANAAAARFMKQAFGVETAGGPPSA
jgi:hypothetical protein